MEPSNWASAHSDALRDYFRMGMSFSEIGRKINSRFGTSYTRNAVIGRAKRMGLSVPKRVERPAIALAQQAAPRTVRPRQAAAPSPGEPQISAVEPASTVKFRCVGISPRLISVLELAPDDCRYPYGGDKEGEEIAFCGHKRHPGSSYCTPHLHLTREFGTASERAARPVVLRLVAAA
jgi:GcrA cell cycle regulator